MIQCKILFVLLFVSDGRGINLRFCGCLFC